MARPNDFVLVRKYVYLCSDASEFTTGFRAYDARAF